MCVCHCEKVCPTRQSHLGLGSTDVIATERLGNDRDRCDCHGVPRNDRIEEIVTEYFAPVKGINKKLSCLRLTLAKGQK